MIKKYCTNKVRGACAINITHEVTKYRDSQNSFRRKDSHRFSIIRNHRATISTPQLFVEENQFLMAEIARLKNQKPNPKIHPSKLGKDFQKKEESDGKRYLYYVNRKKWVSL